MSGKAVGWAMDQVTGSPVTKLVLLKLADNANDNGVAYPSLNLIVSHTELSKRTVIDHLEKLAKKDDGGLNLIVIERGEADGQHFVNRYFLNLKNDPEFDPLKRNGESKRALHHKKLDGAAGVVAAPESAPNGSAEEAQGGSVPATPLVQPTHEDVVSQLHQGSAADAKGSVADAGSGVADANPPAPPIEINPQSNPQREPTQNAGAREPAAERSEGQKEKPAPVVEKEPPAFLRRHPADFQAFVAAWPRDGEGPDEIHAAWRAVTKRPAIEDMLRAVELYRASVEAENATRPPDNQRPWCAATTWLKNRRWEGYLAKAELAAEMARSQPLQAAPWGMHPAGAKLLTELGEEKFNTWMRPCVLSMHEGQPVLTAPSRLIRDRLATEYIDQLERAFEKPVVLQ